MRKTRDNTMTRVEIEELMGYRGWNRTRLAAALDVTENCVARWMIGKPAVSGPAAILLREWLIQERSMASRRKPVPA